MKLLFEDGDLVALRDVVNDFLGVILTDEQARNFLERNVGIATEAAIWGFYDTCIRESVGQTFVQELLGRSLPHFGTSEEDRHNFWEEFETAAIEAGYRLVKTLKKTVSLA